MVQGDLCWCNIVYQQSFSNWNTSESSNNEAFVSSIQWAAPSVRFAYRYIPSPVIICLNWLFIAVKETDYEKQLKEEEKILESIAERKGKER